MLWFQLFMESGEKHIHHLSFTNKKIGKSAKKDISMNEQKRYNLDFWKFQLFYLSNKEILRYKKKEITYIFLNFRATFSAEYPHS